MMLWDLPAIVGMVWLFCSVAFLLLWGTGCIEFVEFDGKDEWL